MKGSPADAGAGYDVFEELGNFTDRGKEQRFVEDIRRIFEQEELAATEL